MEINARRSGWAKPASTRQGLLVARARLVARMFAGISEKHGNVDTKLKLSPFRKSSGTKPGLTRRLENGDVRTYAEAIRATSEGKGNRWRRSSPSTPSTSTGSRA